MRTVRPAPVQVWTASPGVLDDVQWSKLEALLDGAERTRADRFKLPADRRSYVLSHGLLRLALAHALATSPAAIVLSHHGSGKPVMRSPRRPHVCFSLARSRLLVACVVTSLGPVGIDVEPIRDGHADFDLLSRFVALPIAAIHKAEREEDAARRFFFLWTALEAFWKAQGTGLASGNARICCATNVPGACDIRLENMDAPHARIVTVPCADDCAISVALNYPQAHALGRDASSLRAMDGMQLINENPMALPGYRRPSPGCAQPRMSRHFF